jgi:hypothetical protein
MSFHERYGKMTLEQKRTFIKSLVRNMDTARQTNLTNKTEQAPVTTALKDHMSYLIEPIDESKKIQGSAMLLQMLHSRPVTQIPKKTS